MARSLRERWIEHPWIQLGEQIGHLFIAGGAVAIVLGLERWGGPAWPVYAGLCAGVWLATIREFIDGLPIESWGDALLDWAVIVLGATIVGVAFWLV